MKASLYHIQINVSSAAVSLPFYKDLFAYLEYKIIDESSEHIGASNGGTVIWIMQTDAKFQSLSFHRKATGLNHLAFRVEPKKDVDTFTKEFLKPRKIVPLYSSPKPMPEYGPTYYAIYFEDPDRIKLEVVFK